jgi:hypothetical protein
VASCLEARIQGHGTNKAFGQTVHERDDSLMRNNDILTCSYAKGNSGSFPFGIVANVVWNIRAGFEGGVNFFSPQAIISGGCDHRAVPGDLLRLDQPALFRIGNDVTDHRSPKIVPG